MKTEEKQQIELSIVMPCLNEERTLGRCIDKAKNFLRRSTIAGEIIVADNGSTDRSKEIAKEKADKLVEVEKKGYGYALDAGIKKAQGVYVIMGDADDSYDFSNLDNMVQLLREGHEVVMGNRFKGCIRKGAMPWLHRYIGNPLLSSIGRVLFRNNVGDYHCGLRGFRRVAYTKIEPQAGGMEYATEFVVRGLWGGLSFAETPIILHPDGRRRKPHLNTWSDGYAHLMLMVKMFYQQKYKRNEK